MNKWVNENITLILCLICLVIITLFYVGRGYTNGAYKKIYKIDSTFTNHISNEEKQSYHYLKILVNKIDSLDRLNNGKNVK